MAVKKAFSARNRRIGGIFVVFALLAAVLGVRLFYLQVDRGPKLAAAALAERTRLVSLPAARGEILDRNRRPLAVDLPVYRLWADPDLMKDRAKTAALLAPVLGKPAAELRRLLDPKSQYAVLADGLDAGLRRRIEGLKLPGLYFASAERRFYPNGSLAFQVLGFTGDGLRGLDGLESYYQSRLAGRPGRERLVVDAAGNPLPELSAVLSPPRPGETLVLSLDENIQALAEEALRQAIGKTHAKKGLVLVMDPRTGGILAMAQWPEANPNHFDRYPLDRFRNTAIQDVFPPGSTFKPITAVAALSTGVATVQSRFYDPGYKIVTGHMIRGWEYPRSFGWLDFNGIMANSSDVAFMDLGLRLGLQRFMHFARLFNLTAPTGVDLPGEAGGVWLPPNRVEPMDLATMAFGQTESIAPLQLLTAISALGNGGILLRPHVVREILSPTGRVLKRTRAEPVRRVASPTVTREVVRAMEEVVSRGTGTLAAVPGYTLAGKTGTSQLVVHGKFHAHEYLASFVGFGPLPDPRLAILVQLYRPVGSYYGGDIAAPVFSRVMSEALAYLGIPPRAGEVVRPATVRVPDLGGLAVPRAEAVLAGAGLHLDLVGGGLRVVDQFPSAGSPVSYGSLVTVSTVGRLGGRRPAPNLLGESLRQAYRTLLAEGLRLRATGSGVAVSQSPAPGTAVGPGATVSVGFAPPRPPAKPKSG